jgi:septal ring factor EnvC (AmiA/AmiB activator)
MSQTPITVTYSLEEVLGEIKESIKEVNQKLEKLNTIEVELAKLTEKVDGIDNRLKAVEGTQKNQVWALILLLAGAIATAAARLFFTGNP